MSFVNKLYRILTTHYYLFFGLCLGAISVASFHVNETWIGIYQILLAVTFLLLWLTRNSTKGRYVVSITIMIMMALASALEIVMDVIHKTYFVRILVDIILLVFILLTATVMVRSRTSSKGTKTQ